jgi:uncharacterized alpha-E superfamily protein
MLAKEGLDALRSKHQRKRQLKALLTLLDVEIHLNGMGASVGALQLGKETATAIRDNLTSTTWEETRVQLAGLMTDNPGLFVRIARYYERTASMADVLYRSDLPQTEPQEVVRRLLKLSNESAKIRDSVREYTNGIEGSQP